jgi:hypothetical protein
LDEGGGGGDMVTMFARGACVVARSHCLILLNK